MRLRMLLYVLSATIITVGCSPAVKMNASETSNSAETVRFRCDRVNEGVSLNLCTSDPVTLRALLMQGFELYLCRANDTTVVMLPSAYDVSDKIEHHPGEVKATVQNSREKRPDMRPLVAALNEVGYLLSVNNEKRVVLDSYEVSINPEMGELSYDILVPDQYLPGQKFQDDSVVSSRLKDDRVGRIRRQRILEPQSGQQTPAVWC